MKFLAAASKQRISSLPDVPTTAEAGVPNVEISNWFGIFAPHGISPQLVSLINAAYNKALGHPETAAILKKQGIEPVRETPQQFAERLQADGKTYKRVLEEIGLHAQ